MPSASPVTLLNLSATLAWLSAPVQGAMLMLTMMHAGGSDYSDRRLRFRQRAFRSGTLQPNRSRPLGGVSGRRSRLLPFPPRQGQADSLAATDFICSERDQSTAQMRADSTSESCCCRVRCGADAACSAGQPACSHAPMRSSLPACAASAASAATYAALCCPRAACLCCAALLINRIVRPWQECKPAPTSRNAAPSGCRLDGRL